MIEQVRVQYYTSIDSTNIEAHRLFASGQRGPLFLLADEQTAGKGRLDRNWASLRGNCYSTLILPFCHSAGVTDKDLISRVATASPGEKRQFPLLCQCPIPFREGGATRRMRSLCAAEDNSDQHSNAEVDISVVPQIGFVIALAVADVVRTLSPAEPKLKWPNDVLVGGAKIAGILSEVLSTNPLTIAIGCGINVAHSPTGLAYPATCLNAEGANTDRDSVFQSYRAALAKWFTLWNNGQGFAAIRAAWVQQAIGIGETVSMTIGTQHLTGSFEGLTEQGAVVLKPAIGPPHILHAGDLHIPSLARLRNGHS